MKIKIYGVMLIASLSGVCGLSFASKTSLDSACQNASYTACTPKNIVTSGYAFIDSNICCISLAERSKDDDGGFKWEAGTGVPENSKQACKKRVCGD